MAKCHECGQFEVYRTGTVMCAECRRNVLEEVRQKEGEKGWPTENITICSHYDQFRNSLCGECWFGPESGIPIERMPGNTENSRCPRVTWIPQKEVQA